MIVIVLIVITCFLLFNSTKNRAMEINQQHNRESKDSPKFREATESDANGFAIFVVVVLVTIICGVCVISPELMVLLKE